MQYTKALELLNSLVFFDRPPFNSYKKVREKYKGIALERQKKLLKALSNPENSLKVILVAGTSGKGSIATMLAHSLHRAGYKTGLHISPHFSTPRERMWIDGKYISKQRFADTFEIVWKKTQEVYENHTLGMPTYFEVILGMTLEYFKQEKCDYVVLEAGLGGKLDGVNAVSSPILSILTPIDKDHMDVLGNTLKS